MGIIFEKGETMRILSLVVLCLLAITFLSLYSFNEKEVSSELPIENYEPKKIAYAPIECFVNETHYKVECVEESIQTVNDYQPREKIINPATGEHYDSVEDFRFRNNKKEKIVKDGNS